MQPVWVAVVVAAGAAVSTLLTALLTGRQIRAGKEQDWARQDLVAAKAEEAARLLLAANERVAEQTAQAAKVTGGKLDSIHELVNSNLSAQMEEAHAALSQQLVLMREVIALHMAAGRKPSTDALQAIAVIERKVSELGAQLADRAKVTEIADAKLKS